MEKFIQVIINIINQILGSTIDSTTVDVLARTIYGEARGEGQQGMIAVANVIVNRARQGGWWGNSIKEVCLKDHQFSCWNKSDPNYKLIKDVDIIRTQAYEIAKRAVSGDLIDYTGGATHYHTKTINPRWAEPKKISANIGSHVFYKNIG